MANATDNSIQLADISKELTKLWDSEQGKNKIRASLFNLIIYIQKSERTSFYQNLIKCVVGKFPCRVILIINDPQPHQEYLRTEVSSETVGEGEKQIFCELIQIEVGGKLVERVPYIIVPNILPDLPVYLLWTQDPATESTVLPYLEPLANRIIFDSQTTDNLQNYCRAVLSLTERFHCDIGDLNWSAISGWRNIFAQVFNTGESFLSLVHTNLIRIYYNQVGGAATKESGAEAAYLQAWLASRLNWKFITIDHNEGNTRLTYKRPLKELIVLLIPQEGDPKTPGSIMNIEIESEKEKGHYSFKKHPQTQQVFIQYSDKDACQLPYSSSLGGSEAGRELVEEIFYPSGGKHYKEMLELLATIPWKKEKK